MTRPTHDNNSQDGAGAAEPAKPVVCFLGPISSYTHQATLDTFPEDKFELMPVITIKDIFDTTQSGAATYGVVPFENSTNGSVITTLDQFADRDGEYPDLSVCAEIYLDVHHCLLGRFPDPRPPPSSSSSSPPPPPPVLHTAGTFGAGDGSTGVASPSAMTTTPPPPRGQPPACGLGHVRRVYSHPQAFGQCGRFLAAHLRGVETVDTSSTSRAAALAAADPTGASAALSSAAAAAAHPGLGILARDVEDRADNTTRFFVLRRRRRREAAHDDDDDGGPDALAIPGLPTPRVPRPAAAAPARPEEKETGTGTGDTAAAAPESKSLLSFTVPHAEPGALAGVLECFRRRGLNLTSIASRPSLRAPFNYVFFVEFEGHRYADPAGRVGAVLADVARVAQSARWLGSWENMRR